MANGIMSAGSNLYSNWRPEYFPGSTVAGFNPWQMQGMQSLIGGGQALQGFGNQMMGQFSNWMGQGGPGIGQEYLSMMTPEEINAIQGNFEVNPFIEDQSKAFSQAAERAIRENIIPTTSLNALQAGQMGSSRHGIAQGLATGRLGETLQEQLANLHLNAWQNAAQNQLASRGQTLQALGQERGRGTNAAIANARNQLSAYGLIPGLMGAYGTAAMAPGQALLQAGGMLQGNAQNQLNEAQNRWNFYQNRPWDQLSRYASIVQGTPYASPGAPQMPNPFASAAFGAGAGMNMMNMLGGSGGWSPWGSGSSLGFSPGFNPSASYPPNFGLG